MNWRQKLYNLHSLRAAQLMTAAMMNAEEEPVVDQRLQRIRNMHEGGGGGESDSKYDGDAPAQQRSGRGNRTQQRRRRHAIRRGAIVAPEKIANDFNRHAFSSRAIHFFESSL